MKTDYKTTADRVGSGAQMLKTMVPGTMRAFAEMGAATYDDKALSRKVKELMALAIAVTVRCDGCVAYHARAALETGASRAEVSEAVAVAIHMGGGPSMVYGGEVLRAFDEFQAEADQKALAGA